MKIGGQIPWNAKPICGTFKDLLSDGKTPYERRFGELFKGPIIPFGSLVEQHPKTAKDQLRIHQFGKKVYSLDCSSDTHFTQGEFGRVTY